MDIVKPASHKLTSGPAPDFIVYVDGAYKGGKGGSGGVVVLTAQGEVVCAEG